MDNEREGRGDATPAKTFDAEMAPLQDGRAPRAIALLLGTRCVSTWPTLTSLTSTPGDKHWRAHLRAREGRDVELHFAECADFCVYT
jgi:hypothetical protein